VVIINRIIEARVVIVATTDGSGWTVDTSEKRAALDAYWSAQTRQEESEAYARMRK